MATSAYFEVRLDDDDEKSVEKSENRETVAPTGNLGQDFFIKITFLLEFSKILRQKLDPRKKGGMKFSVGLESGDNAEQNEKNLQLAARLHRIKSEMRRSKGAKTSPPPPEGTVKYEFTFIGKTNQSDYFYAPFGCRLVGTGHKNRKSSFIINSLNF